MPSPRAVLADIHDLKLDPTKAHSGVKASGRLHKKVTEEVVDEKLKNGLVELPKAEAKTEVEAEVAPKKPQPPKKQPKKEKVEEPKADEGKTEDPVS